MVFNQVVTISNVKAQEKIEELGLFDECCCKCGLPILLRAKDAPISCCAKCFEQEKSESIRKKISLK